MLKYSQLGRTSAALRFFPVALPPVFPSGEHPCHCPHPVEMNITATACIMWLIVVSFFQFRKRRGIHEDQTGSSVFPAAPFLAFQEAFLPFSRRGERFFFTGRKEMGK